MAATTAAHAEDAPKMKDPADPFAWLEEVEGSQSLDWVRAQNAKSEAALASTPQFKQLEADT
ncbi:MAG TPA: hypothetical protein VGE88_15310, partial [Lysobacter sp.]